MFKSVGQFAKLSDHSVSAAGIIHHSFGKETIAASYSILGR